MAIHLEAATSECQIEIERRGEGDRENKEACDSRRVKAQSQSRIALRIEIQMRNAKCKSLFWAKRQLQQLLHANVPAAVAATVCLHSPHALSRTYCCHSLVCRGCLSTSHCGTFRLSIALGQLIDAHKSVKRVRRGSRQTLEEARREGDSSSLSLCLSPSLSLCKPNHCSRKLENFQLTVNFLPLQLPQSNT